MSIAELAEKLGGMYRDAHPGEAVVMVHLFGVRYANEIRESGASPTDIVVAAGMSEAYGVEVNKGIKLAKYVQVK